MKAHFFTKKVCNRDTWLNKRKLLERKKSRFKLKMNPKQHLSLIDIAIEVFGLILKIFGVFNQGIKYAKNVEVRKVQLPFKKLPESFHGYTVLHFSDLHIDTIQGFEDILIEITRGIECDICLWTGDYRKFTSGAYEHVLPPLKKLVDNVNSKHGIYATLGNHDTYAMLEDLEKMGINMLINESVEIFNDTESIFLTGTDDPHYYPSTYHEKALETQKDKFKIALIHSPEMYEEAAINEYDLYLCGHTHAGQICLPNGYLPIKNLKKGHQFASGLWKYKSMTGYTSAGCGVSGLPVRFNSQGEVTLFTLLKSD